jgi:hypothetical protein
MATLELARLDPQQKRAKQDTIARMDPRQLACRYRHRGFDPLLPGQPLPELLSAEPIGYGVLRITQACRVCTTRKIMVTKRGGWYDPDCVLEYLYPPWWVHVKRSLGFNVTSRDCEAVLWNEQHAALQALARQTVTEQAVRA